MICFRGVKKRARLGFPNKTNNQHKNSGNKDCFCIQLSSASQIAAISIIALTVRASMFTTFEFRPRHVYITKDTAFVDKMRVVIQRY